MTREEKILAIMREFGEVNTLTAVTKATGLVYETVRSYSNVMANNGLLEKCELGLHTTGRPKYAYSATGNELTPELYQKIDKELYEHFIELKERYSKKNKTEEQIAAESEAKERNSQEEQEAKSMESQGIYLMASKPSQHFKNAYKAQTKQIRSEYKSPKNYAGTTAGMVW